MTAAFPRIELQPGYSISRVIKGGWQLAGGHGPVDEKQAIRDMWAFVEAGITTFDCADIYTGVEELIGKFVKECKQVQIHTKYAPDLDELPRLTKSYTEKIIDRSLMRLGVERLDMVQFHWWDYSIPDYIDTAFHLVDLREAGKIRHIGVTNFDAPHLRELLDAGIPVLANQVQYSVFDHRPEGDLQHLVQEYNIVFLCYGTIAGGFLTERYLGMTEFPDPPENRSLVKYRLIIEEFGGVELFQEVLHALAKIACKYNVGIAEIATQYILQRPFVGGVIIGARSTDHLAKINNLRFFVLDSEDIEEIHAVTGKARSPKGPVYSLERDRKGRHGRIMKYNLNKQ
ncbi:MAG: aldo/keto reductase [Candidatus Aminicenantes bacterium]|nr:MAG: aldo/keto reductase [Candidatus Aminicenantes bacterium]